MNRKIFFIFLSEDRNLIGIKIESYFIYRKKDKMQFLDFDELDLDVGYELYLSSSNIHYILNCIYTDYLEYYLSQTKQFLKLSKASILYLSKRFEKLFCRQRRRDLFLYLIYGNRAFSLKFAIEANWNDIVKDNFQYAILENLNDIIYEAYRYNNQEIIDFFNKNGLEEYSSVLASFNGACRGGNLSLVKETMDNVISF